MDKKFVLVTLDKNTLQGKMLRLLLLIISCLLLLMMIVNFQMTVITQRHTTETYVTEFARRGAIEVSQNLDALREELIVIADRIEVKTMVWEWMEEYMDQQFIRDSSKYSMLYVISPDGSYCVAGKGRIDDENLSGQEFVRDIFERGKSFAMTSPDKSTETGEMKYTIAVPVKDDGQILGCVAANVSLNTLTAIVSNHRIGETGYSFITDEKAMVIAHHDEGLIMNYCLNTKENQNIRKGLSDVCRAIINGNEYSGYVKGVRSGADFMICMPIPKTPNWSMIATLPKAEIFAGVNRIFVVMCLFMAFILLVVMVSVHKVLKRTITDPINDLSNTLRQIADGDMTVQCKYKSKDEIGRMAHDLRIMNSRIYGVVKSISEGAKALSDASVQVNMTSQQLSHGVNEQASSIEQLSSSMEQMVSNIEQNTHNAEQTSIVSSDALDKFRDVAIKTESVLSSNKNIAKRILVINDIALKTNILALNAAVEAARAGEYGRGFAVVAAEVRKLAEHSKSAADEIIELSQQGLSLSENMGKVMKETLPKVEDTKSLIGEIVASSAEQTAGSMQINDAIQQLDSVVRTNASESEGLAANADVLSQQAQNLLKTVSFFKVK